MSRNYDGLLPLRGIDAPTRTEAAAWLETLRWRTKHGVPLTRDEARRADRAITMDPDCIMELKASPTPRG